MPDMGVSEIKERCMCGHYRFMHRGDERECLECNAPISRPTACLDGTCCHSFRDAIAKRSRECPHQ